MADCTYTVMWMTITQIIMLLYIIWKYGGNEKN